VSCDAIQERLAELALARELDAAERSRAELEHAAGCADCAAHARFLRALVASLEAGTAPAVRSGVVETARARAARALRAQAPPPRFGRELAGALGVGLLALPVVLAHAWLVARGATALLAPWLPGAMMTWLGVVYFGSLALTVGALYAAIPLAVAWARRTRTEVA
jgi:hypothetical protein